MSGREVLLAEARKHMWAAWQLSAEELASQAASTLLGLGMLVPEGGAKELERYRSLELGALDGRVSASCDNPRHPTWLRAKDDIRGCPWCGLDKAHDDLMGANLSLFEEEQENARLRLALESARRGRRELRSRVAELEAQAAQLAPLREAALHDLPPGTQWRVIATDSESLTGLAPVCTADRRLHEIPDYPGGPKYDDEGVYDCCPWPQVETYSVAVAAYLVALLNADAETQPDSP